MSKAYETGRQSKRAHRIASLALIEAAIVDADGLLVALRAMARCLRENPGDDGGHELNDAVLYANQIIRCLNGAKDLEPLPTFVDGNEKISLESPA